MDVVAATDFRNNFSTYFGQVAFAGDDLLIKKGKHVLKLSRINNSTKKPDIMDLAGIITNDEAKEMKRVIKSIRDLDNDPIRHFKRN